MPSSFVGVLLEQRLEPATAFQGSIATECCRPLAALVHMVDGYVRQPKGFEHVRSSSGKPSAS